MIVRTTTYERSTLVNDEKVYWAGRPSSNHRDRVMDSTGKLVMSSILETEAATILQFFAKVAGGVTTGLLILMVGLSPNMHCRSLAKKILRQQATSPSNKPSSAQILVR